MPCRATKEFLGKYGVQFEVKDVASSPENAAEMARLNGGMMKVPTLVIDETVIVGFDRERILSALGA